MKILQVSKFYKPVMGGIERVAWELAEGLGRVGVRSDVLCSNQQRDTVVEHQPAGYDVVRAGSFGMVLSTSMAPAMVRELRRLASQHELIHLHMPDPMAALALFLVRPRVPVVVHWHSDVIRQRKAMKLYEPLQTWLLRRADAIIATSQAYADSSEPLRAWRSKVRVIPIGISDDRAPADVAAADMLRQRYGGRRIVFALGRMAYYKGFDVLIRAAAALPDDTVVLIGGDGEMLPQLRAQVTSQGLGHKVRLLGHVQDGELAGYFLACDVFCMSSTVRSEAYGVVLLEAMMMGKPIIATDIVGSGVPWVNRHGLTGFNVPVGQPDELARLLSQLLADDALRARLGQAARERYLREFDAVLMTQHVVDLYRRLLAH
ncbi:MAG: glycosyltransferase [Burkholderiaceae bacterium]|nr:glycosyltransferase [Burkholderiaceae bacterium]